MGKINKIIFPLPVGFTSNYPDDENQALFQGDNLVIPVLMENYNAPNNFRRSVVEGVNGGVIDLESDFYEPEFTSSDSRSILKNILDDINDGGNLATQGLSTTETQLPVVVMFDGHEFDRNSDRVQGYTVRVGTMEVESLKGTFRSESGDNHGKGCRVKFIHLFNIVGDSLVDARISLGR